MKKTLAYLQEKKRRAEKIVMLTAYDYPTAVLEDEAGVDAILVGDSVGPNVLGYGLGQAGSRTDRCLSSRIYWASLPASSATTNAMISSVSASVPH